MNQKCAVSFLFFLTTPFLIIPTAQAGGGSVIDHAFNKEKETTLASYPFEIRKAVEAISENIYLSLELNEIEKEVEKIPTDKRGAVINLTQRLIAPNVVAADRARILQIINENAGLLDGNIPGHLESIALVFNKQESNEGENRRMVSFLEYFIQNVSKPRRSRVLEQVCSLMKIAPNLSPDAVAEALGSLTDHESRTVVRCLRDLIKENPTIGDSLPGIIIALSHIPEGRREDAIRSAIRNLRADRDNLPFGPGGYLEAILKEYNHQGNPLNQLSLSA